MCRTRAICGRLGELATDPLVLETMEHRFNNVYGNTISTENVDEFGACFQMKPKQ